MIRLAVVPNRQNSAVTPCLQREESCMILNSVLVLMTNSDLLFQGEDCATAVLAESGKIRAQKLVKSSIE